MSSAKNQKKPKMNKTALNETANLFLLNNTVAILGPGILFLSSLSCIITLKTYLKRLHKYIAMLQMTLYVHNLTSSMIAISQLTYMNISQNHTLVSCGILVQSLVPTVVITFKYTSLLSYLRNDQFQLKLVINNFVADTYLWYRPYIYWILIMIYLVYLDIPLFS